jgi:DNA polymerase elongation subunit (family B)
VAYEPYFFIASKVKLGYSEAENTYLIPVEQKGMEAQVEEWLQRKFENSISRMERRRKEDLKLVGHHEVVESKACSLCFFQPNHLLGYRRTFIQLYFRNVSDLLAVRRELLPIATKNRDKMDAVDTYAEVIGDSRNMDVDFEGADDFMDSANKAASAGRVTNPSDCIIDIREYDVPYYLRVAIDKGSRSPVGFQGFIGDVSRSWFLQKLESAFGTLLLLTPARSHSVAFENALSVLIQSSWPLISRRRRLL